MTSYALESGMMLPDSVCADLAMIGNGFENCTGSTADLARLHSQLAQLVRSAKPNTLRLLHEENGRHAAWRILGPLPSVRRLVSAALVFGALFILTSLSDSINNENMQKNIYSSTGIDQLIVLLFLISAAGLGACSNVLYSISQSIAEGSYDPRDESFSWINIALGVMAGLLLCELLPAELSADANTLVKPLVALLGGFSASLLHRVLGRLVETVGNLFDTSSADRMRLKEQELRLHAIAQSHHYRTQMTFAPVGALNRVREAKSGPGGDAGRRPVTSAARQTSHRSFQPPASALGLHPLPSVAVDDRDDDGSALRQEQVDALQQRAAERLSVLSIIAGMAPDETRASWTDLRAEIETTRAGLEQQCPGNPAAAGRFADRLTRLLDEPDPVRESIDAAGRAFDKVLQSSDAANEVALSLADAAAGLDDARSSA